MCALLLVVMLAGSAWSSPLLTVDPSGILSQYKIEGKNILQARSFDQGNSFEKPMLYFSASQPALGGLGSEEIESFSLKLQPPASSFLAVETSRESSILFSQGPGFAFTKLKILPKNSRHPVLAVFGNQIFSIHSAENTIVFAASDNSGQNWTAPQVFLVTGESLSWPQITTDSNGNPLLAFVSKNSNTGINRVYFSAAGSFEPKALYESYDDIINLSFIPNPGGITLFWQKAYLDRKENFLSLSLDRGNHFSSFELPYMEGNQASLINFGGRWVYPGKGPNSPLKEIFFPPPPAPQLISTQNFFVTNSNTNEVRYQLFNPDPVVCRIELSPDAGFIAEKSYSFEVMNANGSLEAGFFLPPTLKEGQYFLRLSAGNGLTTSPPSKGYQITLYPPPPDLSVIKPAENDWFKPASTLYLSVRVDNPELIFEDEAEASITVNKLLLEDRLTYDKKQNLISGFVTLPDDLMDGKLPSSIRINDPAGVVYEKKFNLNIDQSPPLFDHDQFNPVFSKNSSSFSIPLYDAGIGIDSLGTIIKITGFACETLSSSEVQKVILKSKTPAGEGIYPAEVLPRDLVGNTGKVSKFNLVIDSTPPALVLLSSRESETDQRYFLLEGKAEDQYLSEIKIYANSKMIDSFSLKTGNFSRAVPLLPQKNLIRVEAYDKAGNFSAADLQVQANISSSAALLTAYSNAPNPFSPKNNAEMSFSFTFASDPSDLKIYIFDLTGTLLWKKEYAGINSGNVAWNGTDQFGNKVANGVYPYALAASSGGSNEVRHGKIIVLQ